MNNNPPIQESYNVSGIWASLTTGWSNWFTQVFKALMGWNLGFTTTAILDFPLITTLAQAVLTVTIKGVLNGDTVMIQPLVFQAGIIFNGYVTSNNTVSIYATNITSGSINPASNTFRIIVLQN